MENFKMYLYFFMLISTFHVNNAQSSMRIVSLNPSTLVQVKVSEGLLEGEVVNNEYGGTYCSFKRIPYAQPPVGDLRFKAPQPPIPWEGVRNATEFRSKCYQGDPFKTGPGSEDCLYLNIYTPDVKPNQPHSVMVWIHGGGFAGGSGQDASFGPEFLVRQGVILVTINYRLEVLGFLCLDTADVPGNAAMKDQVQALRWVKKNIAKFGGDPENITIFGQSAGGASISYQLISPMSKGLFKRAIAQSGSSLCDWAKANHPRDRALALARKLGFYSKNDKELYEFFKNIPPENLTHVSAPITINESERGTTIPFSNVDEKEFDGNERFFYGNMVDVVSNGVHEAVDIMTGFTTDETLFIINKATIEPGLEGARNFPDTFMTKQWSFELTVNQQLELGKKIRKFYFNDDIKIPDDWESLLKFCSMLAFIHPTMRWAQLSAHGQKNKLYLYIFSCKSERNAISRLFGLKELLGNKTATIHGDDVRYLFNLKSLPVDMSSNTFKLIDRVTKLWTDFAKYGDPTYEESLGIKWLPYTVENHEYLEIGNELLTGTKPYEEEVKFWDSVMEEYGK